MSTLAEELKAACEAAFHSSKSVEHIRLSQLVYVNRDAILAGLAALEVEGKMREACEASYGALYDMRQFFRMVEHGRPVESSDVTAASNTCESVGAMVASALAQRAPETTERKLIP